jgi:hypothetical protein
MIKTRLASAAAASLIGLAAVTGTVPPGAAPAKVTSAAPGHLHFNLAGYLAMGTAVPLELLLDRTCS